MNATRILEQLDPQIAEDPFAKLVVKSVVELVIRLYRQDHSIAVKRGMAERKIRLEKEKANEK